MTDPTPLPAMIDAGSMQLSAMTTDDLRAELATTLTVTARHLNHLAMVWQELERRGEDLSQLRSGLWSYMPLIARGEVRAELIVRYAGFTTLLKRVARLSLHDQDRLIADDRVAVVEASDTGPVERLVPLARLKAQTVAQVITDRIVSAAEQRVAIERQDRRDTARKVRTPATALDRAALADSLRDRRAAGRKPVGLALSLTPIEAAALDAHCERLGISRARLVTGLLASAGAFDVPARTTADAMERSHG